MTVFFLKLFLKCFSDLKKKQITRAVPKPVNLYSLYYQKCLPKNMVC